MDLDIAACAEVIAVLNDIEHLLVLLLDFNAYLINLENLHCLVKVSQGIKVVPSLVETSSHLLEL
jgi:hypothetical protein